MQLLDRATGHIITAADDANDLGDLVGLAEYVAAAVDADEIALADAEAGLEEWTDEPGALERAAQLTSHSTAMSLLRSCAAHARTAAAYRAAS